MRGVDRDRSEVPASVIPCHCHCIASLEIASSVVAPATSATSVSAAMCMNR